MPVERIAGRDSDGSIGYLRLSDDESQLLGYRIIVAPGWQVTARHGDTAIVATADLDITLPEPIPMVLTVHPNDHGPDIQNYELPELFSFSISKAV